MKALFDTNALLWWCFAAERLSAAALVGMNRATELCYSPVNLWEIGLKESGKGFDFELPDNWDVEIPRHAKLHGVEVLPIEAAHCKRIQLLPFHHRDPFDRMLIAQALEEGMKVIGSDRRFEDYGIGRVW